MLKIIHRYVTAAFLRAFVLIEITAWALFVLIELFEMSDTVAEHNVPWSVLGLYLLYKTPFILNAVTPLAVLLSVFASLGPMAQRSELTAMLAGGISLHQLTRPLWIAAFIFSLLGILGGEFLVPSAYLRAEEMKDTLIEQKTPVSSRIYSVSAPLGENLFLHAHSFTIPSDENKEESWRLESVVIEEIAPDFSELSSIIQSEAAVWTDGGWHFETIRERSPRTGRGRSLEVLPSSLALPPPGPLLALIRNQQSEYIVETKEAEAVSISEIKNDLRNLSDLPAGAVERYTRKLRIDLQYKFAFPLITLILALIATGLVAVSGRSARIWLNLFAALLLAFGYWVGNGITRSLGYAGSLPTEAAVWSIPLFYLLIAFILLRRART